MSTTARPQSGSRLRPPSPGGERRNPLRSQLQKQGPKALSRHFRRAVVRFFVLAAADLSVFWGMRTAVQAIRDQAVWGEAVSGWASAVVPRGFLGGWEFGAGLIIGLLVAGAYGTGDDRRDLRKLFLGAALAVALATWGDLWSHAALVVAQAGVVLFLAWLVLSAERLGVDWLLRRLGWRRPHVARTVFLGPQDEAREAAAGSAFGPNSAYRVDAFVDVPHAAAIGVVDELRRAVVRHEAEVVVVCGYLEEIVFEEVVRVAQEAGCELLTVPRRFSVIGVEPQLVWKQGQPLIELTSPAMKGKEQVLKRVLDIVAGGGGLLVLAPLFALVAVAIKLDSPGPVFYGSPRWGRFGTRMRIWKFRTMVDAADKLLDDDPRLREAYESNIKIVNDPRVTRVGRLLRRWSIDELPQLWNVLLGDMSLVGPRPKLIGEETKYGAALDTVLTVRPGITGLWQVSGRNGTTYEERVALDVKYASHPSIWEDLVILLRTVPVVVRGTGAH